MSLRNSTFSEGGGRAEIKTEKKNKKNNWKIIGK